VSRELNIALPAWVDEVVDWGRPYDGDEARMRIAIALARRNAEERTGGPFGAIVVESATGRVVAAGVNLVLARRNSVLHAEIVALMIAEARVGSYTLGGEGAPSHDLVTSCEPCAMCLGAALWSGVARLVCGATGEDARQLGFDEGPVFGACYDYLAERGVEIVRGVLRDEAVAAFETYRRLGGPIYNP
jgi:tRNA(Arg) A34 adenosine deaminase TadA